MPDTDRLINKAQGDDIISAIQGITARLQEMYAVDDALSSTSEHPVQNKVVKAALDNKADDSDLADKADKSDIAPTKTVSGNPITLTDAAPINAESLVVEFSPKQDLHGQSAPYVGGAGKNKFGTSLIWSLQNSANNDGVISNTTADSRDAFFFVVYVISGDTIVASTADTKVVSENGRCYQTITIPNGSNPDTIRIFHTGGAADIGLYATFRETGTYTVSLDLLGHNPSVVGGLSFKDIQIEEGSTMTSFAPWENICPITGYTECEVDDVGFNQWDEEWELGNLSVSDGSKVSSNTNIRSKNYIPVIGGETYYFTNYQLRMPACYDENKAFISAADATAVGSSGWLLTMPENAKYMLFDMSNNYSTTYLNNLSLNKPNTDHDYHPYHSSNATIQFGQTVYGGSVDFLTGVLTVDREKVVFDNTVTVYQLNTHIFGVNVGSSYKVRTSEDYAEFLSDRYRSFNSGWADMSDGEFQYVDNFVGIRDDENMPDTATAAQYITDQYNAGTPLEFCLLLATPFTIQLTPQELKLLKGTNHITTNGTTIHLGYQPDNVIGEVKGEIQQCIPAPYYMAFDVDSNITDAVPIIFDQATHDYNIVGDGWKDKTFLCIESVDMRMGTLQRILSSDICFVDSALKTILLFPYIRAVEQNVKLSITESSGTYKLSYQSTADASATDYIKFRVRVFN